MRRLFVIPLVGVMLAALAVPVLAEGNTGTLTIPTESQNIEVQGRYDDTTGAITTFSVDIKWGNMKAIYAPNRTKEWDSDNLTFKNVSASSEANPWTWDRTTSSNGVEPNEISITNKSSTNITCTLQFQKNSEFPKVDGTILNKSGTEQEEFSITSAWNLSDDKNTKLQKVTTSGFLRLSGELDSSQTNFQKIGTILVTLN